MTVSITDPLDGSTVDIVQGVPFVVSGTNDTDDDVEGVLTDTNTGDTFPSTGAEGYGEWTLNFDTDGSIQGGDYLSVYAYDTGTGDGDQATYQQQMNGATSPSAERKIAHAAPACITIAPNDPIPTEGVQDIPVTITLPEKRKGFAFLMMLKKGGSPKTSPALVQSKMLSPGAKTTRDVKFRKIDIDYWDYIYVIAAVKGHVCKPVALKIK